MITSFLLSAFVAILNFIATPLLFLPDVSFDPRIATSLATAVSAFKGATAIVPLTEAAIFFSLAAIVVTELLLLGPYKIIMWGIKKIPMIN